MRPAHELALVVATCALLYLSGSGSDVPFYTRGEPREGLVVREMLESGRWLVPTRPEGELARKPPLYYWTAALALGALPARAELALRLPSVILGTAAVAGTWATGRALFGAAAGLPAALLLATAFEWMRAASSARVDMALTAALTAVLAGWMLALRDGGRAGLLVAALGAALGTLAKGPVALALPALAVAAFVVVRRDAGERRRLRAPLVLGVAAVAAGLWYAAAVVREGPAVLDVVARENLFRFLDTDAAATGHAHGGAYLLLLGLVGLLPWTPLLPLAVAPLRARPRQPAAVFAAAWAATTLVFFSLASAKRSVYLLPCFPALALLVGTGVGAAPDGGRGTAVARATAALYAPVALGLAAALATLVAGVDVGRVVRPWLRPPDAEGATAFAAAVRAAAWPLGLLALATVAVVPTLARGARRQDWRRLVLAVAALTVAWTVSFNRLVHPVIAGQRSFRPFLARVGAMVPADGPLYVYSPADPGVRFYAGRALRRWPAPNAPGGHLLLWEDEIGRLRAAGGQPLPVLALSDATQGGHGHLALSLAPPGRLEATPDASPSAPLRRGSRSP